MTADPNTVQPIPEGYHTVTPWIISRDTNRLLEFVKQAFGAEELGRVYVENGAIGHAEFKIGTSIVMAFDAKEGWPDTPCFLRLYVPDGDAVYRQALSAGATPVTEPTNMFWGDRGGRVRDPFGNVWWIQTHVEDVDSQEMEKRATEKQYLDAMRYAQESFDREMSNRGTK
ncbi:glyoxalase [Reticulibacter mediterranei]|uniref:Glyoxalase n=1 Tax=Reticulibacter mediterranei TaxID=2778369 RepID=A0A8J3IW74_9CHLR|nr:VOC family protein [Reticulibacter mediterranei]GHO97935.1 glyoxalase [Reticulibacter mediterranei]